MESIIERERQRRIEGLTIPPLHGIAGRQANMRFLLKWDLILEWCRIPGHTHGKVLQGVVRMSSREGRRSAIRVSEMPQSPSLVGHETHIRIRGVRWGGNSLQDGRIDWSNDLGIVRCILGAHTAESFEATQRDERKCQEERY